ncbi:hypothetical protein SAMN00790413_01898 [Deinococcus hopiensis KR-140]|uniref:Uncharacterized protein n=1 Tax=Deinococcus hopiensis KR-140 TaxID=695939 RepID=A0A1W1VDA7_9DEIO|nr:hypothetical protein SAMN00790413_01030 [Deinococcus hopiensis KR-140]SMB93227.1 hypothetical protein SAMN00790413_01898 [Deinococcus hopiensis KR-140]
MEILQYSDFGLELSVGGETVRATRRVDRYTKPGKWLKPTEYVEIWELEDGRQVRVSRGGKDIRWSVRWRQSA